MGGYLDPGTHHPACDPVVLILEVISAGLHGQQLQIYLVQLKMDLRSVRCQFSLFYLPSLLVYLHLQIVPNPPQSPFRRTQYIHGFFRISIKCFD